MRDHLLLEAGAAYTKTLALIFMAKSRPGGFGVLSIHPHLEFQCIEGVFGVAAE